MYEMEALEDSLVYVKIGKGVVRGKNWEEVRFDWIKYKLDGSILL